jgi:hypothetical protein
MDQTGPFRSFLFRPSAVPSQNAVTDCLRTSDDERWRGDVSPSTPNLPCEQSLNNLRRTLGISRV